MLFLPLKTIYFNQYLRKEKTIEYRLPKVFILRAKENDLVILRKGYSGSSIYCKVAKIQLLHRDLAPFETQKFYANHSQIVAIHLKEFVFPENDNCNFSLRF
jgi:hypothetical protein